MLSMLDNDYTSCLILILIQWFAEFFDYIILIVM